MNHLTSQCFEGLRLLYNYRCLRKVEFRDLSPADFGGWQDIFVLQKYILLTATTRSF